MAREDVAESVGPAGTSAEEARTAAEQSRFEEEWLRSLEPYEVLHNPVLGHEYRFLDTGTDADGTYLYTEFRLDADANHFSEHIHPEQAETWRVLSGEFEVIVDGETQTLGPEEELTLPAGVPHYHGNVSGVESRLLHEIRPAMDFDAGLRMFCELAQAGKTNENGENLLATAVFLSEHPDQLYMADPSIGVQKLLLRVLAPIGRLAGYEAEYPRPE
jgi:quercetin dioxygenase-like cupin family protein